MQNSWVGPQRDCSVPMHVACRVRQPSVRGLQSEAQPSVLLRPRGLQSEAAISIVRGLQSEAAISIVRGLQSEAAISIVRGLQSEAAISTWPAE